MKTFDEYSLEELRVTLGQYLEGSLPEEDKADIEHLLAVSQEAHSELDKLREMTGLLREAKTLFCPQPEDISDYVESGVDPGGMISQHLKECQTCRDEVRLLTEPLEGASRRFGLPAGAKELITGKTAGTQESQAGGFFGSLIDRAAPWFGLPALAAAAAAVVVLTAVWFYQRPPAMKSLAMSSVTWDEKLSDQLGGNLLSVVPGNRNQLAFVVFLKDFRTPLTKEEIDSLYRELKPTEEESGSYRFLDPARVEEVLAKNGIDADDEVSVLKALASKLELDNTVILTVVDKGDRYRLTSKLTETSTRGTIRELARDVFIKADLASELRRLAYAVLFPKKFR